MADERQVSLPRTGWRHVPDEPGEVRLWDGKGFTEVVFKNRHGEIGILEPAWLPDPEGDPDRFRYWDGSKFTSQTFDSIPNDGDFVYEQLRIPYQAGRAPGFTHGVVATPRARWEEIQARPPEPWSKRLRRFVRKYGVAIVVILFLVALTTLGLIYGGGGGG